ncbi:conjugal transfer protein [Halobaculum limi]|uniref:conjugal transfer protein n=1 Tax=Halobaculum limi TaxID=3031916 RepID=UPI0024051F9B|nr:conjugal transfer protein [Halobaculum sp. YSMS11]
MNRTYIQIIPTAGSNTSKRIPETIGSLHQITSNESQSLASRLNPLKSQSPLTFEFLAVSEGVDAPVEFYYGVDDEDHLDTLEERLRTIYPYTFNLVRRDVDLDQKLGVRQEGDEPDLEKQQVPAGVEWHGKGRRKRDWMTTISPFIPESPSESDSEEPHAPLTPLIDHLSKTTVPVAFQVVFQSKPDWSNKAENRQIDLELEQDTLSQIVVETLLGPSDPDSEIPLNESTKERLRLIDEKTPKRTFTVNARLVAIPGDDSPDSIQSRLNTLRSVFAVLDGPYYEFASRRLQEKGLTQKSKSKHARQLLSAVRDRTIRTGRGKSRPDLVLNGNELANLIIVPTADGLTTEGSRSTRSEQESRNPLPRPNPDLMMHFREGMEIGYALDENGTPEDKPVCIPPSVLPTHYLRAATTGAGKSKAVTNDGLSVYESTSGPVIIIDRKGDGMAEEYLRAHTRRFGISDVEENVLYFPIPDILPGFSFFNITSSLEQGQQRADAVQRKADHYEEILKLAMGAERYERATVSPLLIKALIKTLFDEEYGRENGRYRASEDYFAHEQLEHALDQLWQAGPPNPNENEAPRSSDPEVLRTFRRQLQSDARTFANIMGGVSNRLAYVSQDTHLRQIFNNTEPQFDFGEQLDSNRVILFDLGGLRDDSAKMLTGVILTALEDALRTNEQALNQQPDDYVVNLLIDEAASVVVSDVMNNLLEQGRSFRLSVGLSMQFPEQLEAEGGRRVYLNALNNIGSPILGKINVDRELARALAHEDLNPTEFANRIRSLPRGEWIAQLPSPVFGKTGPYPFSIKPLPIPSGHSESEFPLSDREENRFQEMLTRLRTRVSDEFGVHKDSTPAVDSPSDLRELLGTANPDLDYAFARVIRTVQIRSGTREDNGWVPVETVDSELRSLYSEVDAEPPTLAELAAIRKRSRLIDVEVDLETDELVVRLTEAGESEAKPDTGDVRAAGGDDHDTALLQVEKELTALGFTVSILTQDGSEKPDARATHPNLDSTFAIEVETTTPDNPVKVLTNLRKAQEALDVPVFVVRPGKSGTEWAKRVEGILSPPVRELQTGETRFYTGDSYLSFNGGANEVGGVTAVRNITPEGTAQNIWKRDTGDVVLCDAEGTEYLRVDSLSGLSQDYVPAVYSYDPTTTQYVVHEHGTRHVYDSKSEFEAEWVRIKRPFIPEDELPVPAFQHSAYAIIILGDQDEPVLYDCGETRPLSAILDETPGLAPTETDNSETQSVQAGQVNTAWEETDEDDPPTLESFVESDLVEERDSVVPKQAVFNRYREWAAEHDISDPLNKSWFSRKLNDHLEFGSTRLRVEGTLVHHYTGIRLRTTQESEYEK